MKGLSAQAGFILTHQTHKKTGQAFARLLPLQPTPDIGWELEAGQFFQ